MSTQKGSKEKPTQTTNQNFQTVSLEKNIKDTLRTLEKQYHHGSRVLQDVISNLKNDFIKTMKQKKVAQQKVAALTKQFKKKSSEITKAQWKNAKDVYKKTAKNTEHLKRQLEKSLDDFKHLIASHKKFTELNKAIDNFEKKWSKKKTSSRKPRKVKVKQKTNNQKKVVSLKKKQNRPKK